MVGPGGEEVDEGEVRAVFWGRGEGCKGDEDSDIFVDFYIKETSGHYWPLQ